MFVIIYMSLFHGLKIEICKYLTFVDYMKLVKADTSYNVLNRNEVYDLFTGNGKLSTINIGELNIWADEYAIYHFKGFHKNCECLDDFLLNFRTDFYNDPPKGCYLLDIHYDGLYYTREDNFKHKLIKLYSMTNLRKFYRFMKKVPI